MVSAWRLFFYSAQFVGTRDIKGEDNMDAKTLLLTYMIAAL